jgi:hypothetical protein
MKIFHVGMRTRQISTSFISMEKAIMVGHYPLGLQSQSGETALFKSGSRRGLEPLKYPEQIWTLAVPLQEFGGRVCTKRPK